MFEYFPGNYIWNLGVAATLNSGGMIDEVDRACRPIREQAEEAEKAGHRRTAGQKYLRAAAYLCQAERMQSATDPNRRGVYQHCLDLMQKSFDLNDPLTTRVSIPFEGTTLPAYFTNASTDGAPAPVMIMWNGLDSKEHMYTSGWPLEMAARGISVLQVDCPGSGEALRFGDLKSQVETEDWAEACVDYLETRDDVRTDRIGLVGWSLGGYYVPRAAAFEKRLALAVAWGANHDWGAVQKRRLEREGENPVPHYWDHVLWVWGYDDVDTFIAAAEDVRLDGIVEKIECAFLITHGENDRQIPVAYAHRSYDQAVNASKRTLRVFTPDEGATEHIGLDHLPHVGAFTADWIEDTAGLFAAAGATVVGCDIAPTGGEAQVDLTDEDAVRRWVDAAAQEHGRIDVLHANAGATRFHPIEEVSAEEWNFVLRHELDVVFSRSSTRGRTCGGPAGPSCSSGRPRDSPARSPTPASRTRSPRAAWSR